MRQVLLSPMLLFAAVPAAAQQPAAAEPARELFLYLFRPGPAWVAGRPMRQQNLREHGAYHARLVEEGRSVAGGGYIGEDGGMAIIRAADLAEAQAMLAADPAIVNGVFAAEIRQWRPRFHSDRPLVEIRR
ncbi:MAG: YciI family protein [Sphingosinicella sp.]|uniref:YciI family protein n=1 Tax=Sphingosinicella sp. TaxID=1917971 RepID=UPI004038050E